MMKSIEKEPCPLHEKAIKKSIFSQRKIIPKPRRPKAAKERHSSVSAASLISLAPPTFKLHHPGLLVDLLAGLLASGSYDKEV